LLFQQLAIPHESLHEQDHELMAQIFLKRLKSYIVDKIMIFDPGERTSEIHHQQKGITGTRKGKSSLCKIVLISLSYLFRVHEEFGGCHPAMNI